MKKLLTESTATPKGSAREALVAGPPLPINPGVPLPATVVITPVAAVKAVTIRMRLLSRSAMKTFSEESSHTDGQVQLGACRGAALATKPLSSVASYEQLTRWLNTAKG